MKLKRLLATCSIALVVVVLALPAWAQQGNQNGNSKTAKDPNHEEGYSQPMPLRPGELRVPAAGGMLTSYDHPLPEINAAASANWLLHNGDLQGTRYSSLDQITTANVKNLTPRWLYQTGHATRASFHTTPIVADGLFYMTDPIGVVHALDAVTGHLVWQFNVRNLFAVGEFSIANRGVCYGDGVLYFQTNSSVYALDAKTGVPLKTFGLNGKADPVFTIWKDKYALKNPIDVATIGYSFTGAPTFYNGVVFVAPQGSERHIPGGLLIALDAKTGAIKWSWNTVPQGPADDGWDIANGTWVGGVRNGGAIWETPTIDPDLGLIIASIGNPSPDQDGSGRKGINLFTSCVVALDIKTGKMKWYYQTMHHEIWDYDSVQPAALFDITIGNKKVKALAHGNKNGLLFILDRETGKPINPIPEIPVPTETQTPGEQAWPTQPIPYTKYGSPIEPVVPIYPIDVPAEWSAKYPLLAAFTPPKVSGGIHAPRAGVEFGGNAWSPRTGLVYVGGLDVPIYMTSIPVGATLKPGQSSTAGNRTSVRTPYGNVSAYDPVTGLMIWRTLLPGGIQSGVLATAGDLVFGGDSVGTFYAFDAKTGQILYQFFTGSGIHGGPITYQINGVQYVSVSSGGGSASYSSSSPGDLMVTWALPKQ